MKSIDEFLRDVLTTDYRRGRDYVQHLGYEYGQLLSYFRKVQRDHPSWIGGGVVEAPEDIIGIGYRESAKWEIEQFLKSGGYAQIEEKARRTEDAEIESIKLAKAQQKEIDRNTLFSLGSFSVAILSLVIAAIALFRSC